MPETDLTNTIATNAAGPQSASDDFGSVTQQNLRDQIAADRYLAEKQSQSAGGFPFKRTKVVPPGAS